MEVGCSRRELFVRLELRGRLVILEQFLLRVRLGVALGVRARSLAYCVNEKRKLTPKLLLEVG